VGLLYYKRNHRISSKWPEAWPIISMLVKYLKVYLWYCCTLNWSQNSFNWLELQVHKINDQVSQKHFCEILHLGNTSFYKKKLSQDSFKMPSSLPHFEQKNMKVVISRRWILWGCQNISGFRKCLLSSVTCSQIWLFPLVNGCHCAYMTKL
jgi:hypothetical protein